MIFASRITKKGGAVVAPAAANTEAVNPVEQTLREAAAWEPHCSPPADFAAFTKQAIEKRSRNTFPPASGRPALSAQWVRGLRAPLAASLALGLVLWVGGSGNDGSAPDPARATTRPVFGEKSTAPSRDLQTPQPSGPVVQATEQARLIETSTTDAAPAPHYALASHRATVRRHKRRGAVRNADWKRAEKMLAAQSPKKTNSAPLWKTETVERPAWGALIPATFACTTPASNETGTGSQIEETTTLMPVVLDVALPDTENLAAASSTDALPPSPAP